MATDSGLKGDSPLAISSALTNSLQFNKSGKTEYEAVVLPVPLHPAIMYKIGLILHYWRKIPQAILLAGFHLLVIERSDRDSNSGYPFGVYTLSRRASSATRAPLLWVLQCKDSGLFLIFMLLWRFFLPGVRFFGRRLLRLFSKNHH